MDVAKVDRNAAIVVHVCCKLRFPMFHLSFKNVRYRCIYLDVAYVLHNIASVSSVCCVCFTMVSSVFEVFL
jgi:hypothetical protein